MSNKGKWVTVYGRKVFIADGQSLEQTLAQGGKVDNVQSKGANYKHKALAIATKNAIDKLNQSKDKDKMKDTSTIKNNRDIASTKGKNKTQDEFFGIEYKDLKGAEAIEKLLHEKQGHIKNAFERPEIGGIDLVWGYVDQTNSKKGGGLVHLIARRNEEFASGKGKINGLDMVKKIPTIIENGEFALDINDHPRFEHNGYRVAIKPTYDGKKLNWIVSAMEIRDK